LFVCSLELEQAARSLDKLDHMLASLNQAPPQEAQPNMPNQAPYRQLANNDNDLGHAASMPQSGIVCFLLKEGKILSIF